MRITIEVDVTDDKALNLIRQTLGYMTGVGDFKLSYDDSFGHQWSHASRGSAVAEIPKPADLTVEVLENLAETFDTWAGNIAYNNRDNRPEWEGRMKAYRESAREVRRRIKEMP